MLVLEHHIIEIIIRIVTDIEHHIFNVIQVGIKEFYLIKNTVDILDLVDIKIK